MRHIRFHNILCRGESGVHIRGYAESRPEGIVLDNVRVEINKTTRHAGGEYDCRPGTVGVLPHRIAGIYGAFASDVVLRNTDVVWGPNRPEYYGPALECHSVARLRLENFRGEAAHPERDMATLVDETTPG